MNDKEKKAFVARMKKGKKDAAKRKKIKSQVAARTHDEFGRKFTPKWTNKQPFAESYMGRLRTPASMAKSEMMRVDLLLDDYKSGYDHKSDPPRSKIEKSGSLAGWLSYAKKFRISTAQAKKVWFFRGVNFGKR